MRQRLVAYLLLLLPVALLAQGDPAFDLLDLPGDRARVRYTPGSLDRSSRVQDQLDRFLLDLARRTKLPVATTAMVLSREEWSSRRITRPYGAPAFIDGIVALPAFGDEGTVAVWRELIGALPAASAGPLRGSPEEDASLALADLVVLPQLATALLERQLRGEEPWIAALAGQVAHRLYLERYQPGRAAEVAQLYQRATDKLGEGIPSALGDYDRTQTLPAQLAWDARLWQAAGIAIDEDGGNTLKRLLKLQDKGDGLITRRALMDRYDDLGTWARGLATGHRSPG